MCIFVCACVLGECVAYWSDYIHLSFQNQKYSIYSHNSWNDAKWIAWPQECTISNSLNVYTSGNGYNFSIVCTLNMYHHLVLFTYINRLLIIPSPRYQNDLLESENFWLIQELRWGITEINNTLSYFWWIPPFL